MIKFVRDELRHALPTEEVGEQHAVRESLFANSHRLQDTCILHLLYDLNLVKFVCEALVVGLDAADEKWVSGDHLVKQLHQGVTEVSGHRLLGSRLRGQRLRVHCQLPIPKARSAFLMFYIESFMKKKHLHFGPNGRRCGGPCEIWSVVLARPCHCPGLGLTGYPFSSVDTGRGSGPLGYPIGAAAARFPAAKSFDSSPRNRRHCTLHGQRSVAQWSSGRWTWPVCKNQISSSSGISLQVQHQRVTGLLKNG